MASLGFSMRKLPGSTRCYATTISSASRHSKTVPPAPILGTEKKRIRRDPKRPYPARKAHLYSQYTQLITSPAPRPTPIREIEASPTSDAQTESSSQRAPSVILINHENFSVSAFTKLRGELATTVAKTQATRDRLAIAKGQTAAGEPLSAKFQVIRSGLFLPAVRKTSGKKEARKLEKILKGPIGAVVLPGTLDPPLLTAILRIIEKAAPTPAAEANGAAKKGSGPSEDDFEPKPKPVPVPKIKVVGAYIDGKVHNADKVKEIAQLPRLEELRAQIIGLIGAPAMKLAGVLSAASGGRLALTLEGFMKGLEDGDKAGSS